MRSTRPQLSTSALDPAVEALAQRLRAHAWSVLRTDPAPGAWNMALDEALLEAAAREEIPPTLRFYGWSPPALSLGRFQTLEGVNTEELTRRGWDLVRRPTGGRAVLHHLELTYSLVVPPSVLGGAGIRTSYAVLSAALNAGLRALLPASEPVRAPEACAAVRGEPNCFALASECDSLVADSKIAGSAQVRRDGALLQHGSLLLDADREAWKALFGSAGRLVTYRDLIGVAPAADALLHAVAAGFQLIAGEMTQTALDPELTRQATDRQSHFVVG